MRSIGLKQLGFDDPHAALKQRRHGPHHYRYERPPRKRKAVAIEVPAVVKEKSSRRPAYQVAAEVISLEPRLGDGAAKATTAIDASRDRPVTGGGKLKLATVTARRPKAVNLPTGLLPDTQYQRRGEAADALWRELVRRVRRQCRWMRR